MNINGLIYDLPEAEGLRETFFDMKRDFPEEEYSLKKLEEKYATFYKTEVPREEQMKMLVKAAVELTTQEAPKWEMIAARIYLNIVKKDLKEEMRKRGITSFYKKICYLTCLLYTSPSPRDGLLSRMPSSA